MGIRNIQLLFEADDEESRHIQAEREDLLLEAHHRGEHEGRFARDTQECPLCQKNEQGEPLK